MNEVAPRPGLVGTWVLAIRPATLTAGAAPVLVGWAIAASTDGFVLVPALAALAAALLVQIGTNLANDYFDFKTGADNDDRIGPARATQKGWLTPQAMARATALVLVLAAAVGTFLAFVGGWPVVVIAVVSIVCAVAYTGGPMPLAYVGLGDLFVLVFFGPVAVAGTVYVQTLQWPVEAVISGTALGLLATAILVVNNLRDRHTDAAANKRTLAVRFGARAVRIEYTVAVVLAYALCIGWFAASASWAWLTPLLTMPLAVHQVRKVWTLDGPDLNPELGATARLLLAFSACLAAGLAIVGA